MYLEKLEINMYSLCLFVGAVIALFIYFKTYILKYFKGKKYFQAYIFSVATLLPSVLVFVIGAYILDNFFHYLNGEEFGSSGISFLGGAIVLLLIFLIVLLFKPKNGFVNQTIMLIPLLHCFGRIGCLFAGCCFGIPCSFGVCYWEGSRAVDLYGYGTPLFPTQILEAIVCLAIFFLLFFKLKENRFFWYCTIYGIYRFFAEFLRGDNRGSTLTFLSPSQLMSIILLIYAAIYYFVVRRKIIKQTALSCDNNISG